MKRCFPSAAEFDQDSKSRKVRFVARDRAHACHVAIRHTDRQRVQCCRHDRATTTSWPHSRLDLDHVAMKALANQPHADWNSATSTVWTASQSIDRQNELCFGAAGRAWSFV